MKDYHINIFYSNEDGGYIADIPDLAGCSSFGDSAEKALKELKKARKLWLAAAKAKKSKVPPPLYRPFIYQIPEAAR